MPQRAGRDTGSKSSKRDSPLPSDAEPGDLLKERAKVKRRGGIIRGRWIVAACISLVSFAPALVSQGIACSSAPFKAITIEYDPVIDSTTASTEPHRFGAHYQIVVQARRAGRSNGEAVTPGLWFQTTDFLAGSSDFAVLIDDSVRFAWKVAGQGVQTLKQNWLVGDVTAQYFAYQPPAAELARFAFARKALIAVAGQREEMKEKDLRRFAEISRWAACPADRPLPKTVK